MAFLNGRLPRIALAPITKAVNGEQAYLAKNAAKAFNAMNAESEARFSITLQVTSARVAYRPLKDQNYFWDQYLHHGGALAAKPGSSNHGWGLAIDLGTQRMREIVDEIGARYGWAKRWSDAPTEWWHIKYRAGIWDGKTPYAKAKVLKPGVKGPTVIKLKKLMRSHGLQGFNRFTPLYDRKTVSAIRRLQKRHGLHPDGIVGQKTWDLLGKG